MGPLDQQPSTFHKTPATSKLKENPVNKKLSFLNCFLCRGAEDVELWFTEVENLLALEDVGKVNYW